MALPCVHVALLEVRPLKGCALFPGKVRGAFLRCYVHAVSTRSARARIRKSMAARKLKVVGIDWCVREDGVQWEKPESRAARKFILAARRGDDVIVGRADSW